MTTKARPVIQAPARTTDSGECVNHVSGMEFFWKCRKLLKRQGYPWNHKGNCRVHKRINLDLRSPAKRRLRKRLRVRLYEPQHPDTAWSADFMSDTLANGRRFRTFNVADHFNRAALHIEIDTSITSIGLVRAFAQIRAQYGIPKVLRMDNGPEFLGENLTHWAKQAGMAIQSIQPGKPNLNVYIEWFNRIYRDELLDQYLLVTLDYVREATH